MEINDVVYVNNFGISKVVDLRDETAYIMPLYGTVKGTITVSKESKNVRNLLSKEEAVDVIEKVNQADTVWINKFIDRENEYSKIKANPSPLSRFLMVKTIYNQYKYKKDNKIKGGLASRDLDFFHKSLSLITNEFCTVLGLTIDEFKKFISNIWKNDIIFDYYNL